MIIAGSFWRKVVVTAVAAVGFVSLYEATMLDSKDATLGGTASATSVMPPPAPGTRLAFSATAYCKGLTTAAGVAGSGRHRRRGSGAPPGRLGRRDRLARTRATTASTRSWTPGRRCRAAESTSTCGAATRRCSSGASPFASPCCASAGTRRRRRPASWIGCSSADAEPQPLPSRPLPHRRPLAGIRP